MISIPTQLEHFKEYKKRMESTMGKEKLDQHIKKSVFIISAGTNDYIVNYFSLPIRKKTYTISAYQQFVLQNAKNLVKVNLNLLILNERIIQFVKRGHI